MAYVIGMEKMKQESANKAEQRGEEDGEENDKC